MQVGYRRRGLLLEGWEWVVRGEAGSWHAAVEGRVAMLCPHPTVLKPFGVIAASTCAVVLRPDSGKQKQKQKSFVRGAQGCKLLPGEKKRLRKEKIQVRW